MTEDDEHGERWHYTAGRPGEEEGCISQTSDLHQIDPLSQQDQLYARGVFLSSRSCTRSGSAVSERERERALGPTLTRCATGTDPQWNDLLRNRSFLPRNCER